MGDILNEGDIVIVSCVLTGLREYPVTSIEGNRAKTAFRTFNKKIYPGGSIYEFGNTQTTNSYWIKGESS